MYYLQGIPTLAKYSTHMKKLILLLTALFLGTICMAYIYFSRINSVNSGIAHALNISTHNASFVFEFTADQNFMELMSEQDILDELIGTTLLNELIGVKNVLLTNKSAKAALENKKILIGAVVDSIQNEVILLAQLDNQKTANKFIDDLINDGILKNGEKNIYTFQVNDSLQYYAGITDDVFLVAAKKNIIEERLKLQSTSSTPFKEYIESRQKVSKPKLISLYVNYNKIDSYLSNILKGKLDGELAFLNKSKAFAELNYNFSKDKLQLYGTTKPDPRNTFISLFSGLKPVSISINNILPANTAAYKIYGISDITKFQEKLDLFFKEQKMDNAVQTVYKNIQDKYYTDIKKVIAENFKNEIMTFQLSTGERLGAIAFKNGDKISQILLELGESQDNEIGIFKEDNIPYALFGDAFKRFNRPYFILKDNYLIFTPNASTLRNYIDNYTNGKLLTQDVAYSKFRNEFPSDASIVYFYNLQSGKELLRRDLKPSVYKQFNQENSWKDYSFFTYQMSGDNGIFITNLLLNKVAPKAKQITELELDSLKAEISL